MKKLVSLLLVLLLGVSAQALEERKWIALAPNLFLPPQEQTETAYPRTLVRGAKGYDEMALIEALLGEDYETEERTQWSHSSDYTEAKNGRKPWEYRSVIVYDDSQTLHFNDPWVSGERGGEYEAPKMNMTVQESTVLARSLAGQYLDEHFLANPSAQRQIRERWSQAGRWMTEKEYDKFMRDKKMHYVLFDQVTDEGVAILDENVMVVVGLNGLGGMMLNWHEFTASAEKAQVMPLDQALDMANSTREAKTTLLAAEIVYSNRVTQNLGRPEEYNLGWLLITSGGNYFVDCVENAHVCDSYEY